MGTAAEALAQIEDKLLATDPQDVQTIELLKSEHARVRSLATNAAAKAGKDDPASTPVEGAGGAAFGVYPKAKARPQNVSDAGAGMEAVALMAPVKGVAGAIDLAGQGGRVLLNATTGLNLPKTPALTPIVDRWTDQIAGRPVENSVARSAFEGAIMGPLSGGKTAAQVIPQMVSGGAGGAAADASNRAGAHPLVSALLGMGAGVGAGKVAGNIGLTPAEMLAKGRVQRAGQGVTPGQYAEGSAAQAQAQREGVQLLPSQALQTEAAGYEELQRQLLASQARKGDSFREGVAKQPGQVQAMIERLRTAGGQTPRPDDDLATGVQRIAAQTEAAGPKAVNAATRPLYNDPLGKAWQLSPATVERVGLGLDDAIFKNRADAATANALKEAKAHLDSVLNNGQATPEILARALQSVKNDLPSYSAYPTAANNTRRVVAETVKPLEDLIARHAPDLGRAPQMQAQLRQDLPTPFSEISRQEGQRTGTEGALNAATSRPEVMGAVQKADPLLAQELVQRQLNGAIDTATARSATTGLPAANSGVKLKNLLTEGLKGREFQRNLDMLFPGRPDEAMIFQQRLEVASNASKPRGDLKGPAQGSPLQAQEIAIKGSRGLAGQLDYVMGGLTRALAASKNRLSDDAVIHILQQPDVIDRLAKLSSLPAPRLTRAAFIAAVPQLFEEEAPK